MTANHEYFELLCVLAASDDLTDLEVLALRQHAPDCVFCRSRILEMTQLRLHSLLAHAGKHRGGRLPEGMRERFISRAIGEGVPLTARSPSSIGRLGLASMLFATLLIFTAMVDRGVPMRSIVDTFPLQASRSAAPLPVDLRGNYGDKPTAPSLAKRAVRRNGHVIRPAQQSFPSYLGIFDNRDLPVRFHLPHDTPLRSRFQAPPALRRSSPLNLLANFQPETSSAVSRTFEFSGSPTSRLFPVPGSTSR